MGRNQMVTLSSSIGAEVLSEKDFSSALRILISNCFIDDIDAEQIFSRIQQSDSVVLTVEDCLIIHRHIGKQLTACIYEFATNDCRRDLLNVFLLFYYVVINTGEPILITKK